MKQLRQEWKAEQPTMNSASYVFIDETWASTNMTRTNGRCPQGECLVMAVPHG